MPPCNCGGGKNRATRWEFTSPTGAVRVYNSQVEAEAAKIRAKGGTVKAVPVR